MARPVVSWVLVVFVLATAPFAVTPVSACSRFNGSTDKAGIDAAGIRFFFNTTNATVIHTVSGTITPYYRRSDCYQCAFSPLSWNNDAGVPGTLPLNRLSYNGDYCRVTSNFDSQFRFFGNDSELYETSATVGQNGLYTLRCQIDAMTVWQCEVETDSASENPYVAMVIVFPLTLLALAIAWLLSHRVVTSRLSSVHSWIVKDRSADLSDESVNDEYGLLADNNAHLTDAMTENNSTDSSVTASSANEVTAINTRTDAANDSDILVKRVDGKVRLLSLDTFRGLSLSIMIFVNMGGGSYYFFNHSEWDGLTVADLVFPWFIWMMGCSMAISFHSMQKKQLTKGEQLLKIVRRTVILFFLGLLVSNGSTSLTYLRVMGVLQRFSTSYLIVSLILLYVPKRAYHNDERPWLNELVPYVYEYLTVLAIIIIHTIITFTLHRPGCPVGYLGPGGLADYGQYMDNNCVGGAAGYLDWLILGPDHTYSSPTCQTPYQCGAYDPEGLLGILTSAVMVYLGVLAGRVITHNKGHRERLVRWGIGCALCGVLALGLCGGTQYEGVIPVNKNLWSLSFILTLSCFAYFNLLWLYAVIDIYKAYNGAPFRQMGQNSIMIYVCSETIGSSVWPFAFTLDVSEETHLTRLYHDVMVVVLHWLIACYAAAIGFFINI